MNDNIVTKSAVSVTEMARMVGLSRARFYQLVRRGTFPPPDEDPLSKRPFFSDEKQRLILDARRRNCGVDGVVVMFYSRRKDFGQTKAAPRPAKPKSKSSPCGDLIDQLAQVKIAATVAQVEPLVNELYPQGIEGIDPGEVFLAVLERLRGKGGK